MKRKYKKPFNFNTENYDGLTVSELKRQADYWLRQYLLQREGNTNYIHCPLKNKSYPVETMQVAHYIDRQCLNTRYDLTNCHLVSTKSNTWDAQVPKEGYKSLHHYDYEQYLGEQIVKDLRERSKIIKIFQRADYIEVINKFKGNE